MSFSLESHNFQTFEDLKMMIVLVLAALALQSDIYAGKEVYCNFIMNPVYGQLFFLGKTVISSKVEL